FDTLHHVTLLDVTRILILVNIKHPASGTNHFICLKVKLTLGSVTFFVGAILCSQCFCVSPFISINEPLGRSNCFFSADCLCLKSKRRCAPKLKQAIEPLFTKSFSPSLCYAIPSSPL